MNIAVLTEAYLPSIGGQEVRFAELAEALVAQQHQVSVFCVGHSRVLQPYEVMNGVEVHRFPLTDDYKRTLWKPLRRNLKVTLQYALWCRQVAKSGRFDAYIYNQWPLAHIVFAPKSAHNAVIDWCEIRSGLLFRTIQAKFPRLMRANMAVSPAVRAHIAEASKRQVAYIPSGIWTDRYRCLTRNQRDGLLYVGRIMPHKNVSLLVSTFKLLRQQGYTGRLTIAGVGPCLPQIEAEVNASGVSEFIDVLGFVDDATKIGVLSRAAIAVIPSRREGFPRVVAEAMASGLPVVTVNYPDNGTKEVVQHYGIGLVSKPNEKDLASAIAAVESDWTRYSEAGLAARADLDWSVVSQNVLHLLQATN